VAGGPFKPYFGLSGRLRRLSQKASGSYSGGLAQPAGVTFSGNNNRVDLWAYDAAGNVLSDGVNRYEYDAEGRQTGVLNAMSGLTGYIYDAEGRRVEKVLVNHFGTPQATTTVENEYLLGLNGEQVSVLGATGNWLWTNVYADGNQLATYFNSQTYFALTDWLGTKRAEAEVQVSGTTATATLAEHCTSLPFGDGQNCGGTDPNQLHFTGKQRDTESTNDYFDARFYASNIAGRFLTPDPSGLSYADPNNPQSLNLYAYVRNNPLRFVDPSGMDCIQVNTGANEVLVAAGNCGLTGGTFVNGIVDPKSFAYNSNGDLNFSFSNSATGTTGSGVIGLSGGQDPLYNQQVAAAAQYFALQQSQASPTSDQLIQQLSVGITTDSQHSFGCIAQAYGFGGPGTAAYQLGQPVAGTKRFVSPGSSLGTSPISDALSTALPIKGSFRAPVGGPGTGVPFRMTKTGNLGRALGRYAPFAGLAADAYAAVQLWKCL
jgi:RHS repeat-associated protein